MAASYNSRLHGAHASWGRTAADAGFTLIELVVALSIFALAAGAGLIAIRDAAGTTRLAPFAAHVATELKAARARAILSARPVAFVLDPKHRTYRIGGGTPIKLPDAVSIAVRSAHHTVGPVVFYPDGSSSGGAVRIAIGNAAILLDVAWLNGAVDIRSGG